MAILCTKNH